MTEKERIELKLEILEDIRSCIKFSFMTVDKDTLDLNELNSIIDKYKYMLKGINMTNEN